MKRMLKIGVDARPLSSPNSGMGRYLGNLLREFAAANVTHQIFLYCDRPFTLRFPLPEHWKIRTGKVESRGLSTAFAQLFFPVWSLRDKVDVFWSPRHQLPLLLPPWSRKVLTVHDVAWNRFPQTMARSNVVLEALLMPLSLRIANQAITDSQFARSEILEYFPDAGGKLGVVYLASDLKTEGETGSCPLTRPYFLFVGSYEPRKNLKRHRNSVVWIVSTPPFGMASRAFTTRFITTCSICPRSACTGARFGVNARRISTSSPITVSRSISYPKHLCCKAVMSCTRSSAASHSAARRARLSVSSRLCSPLRSS